MTSCSRHFDRSEMKWSEVEKSPPMIEISRFRFATLEMTFVEDHFERFLK